MFHLKWWKLLRIAGSSFLLAAAVASPTQAQEERACWANPTPIVPLAKTELKKFNAEVNVSLAKKKNGPPRFNFDQVYETDIDNDGQLEKIGATYEDSGNYLNLSVFKKTRTGYELITDAPFAKDEYPDKEGQLYHDFKGVPLLRLCGNTYLTPADDLVGAVDGYLWQSGRTTRSCDTDWVAYQHSLSRSLYESKQFVLAANNLTVLLKACGGHLNPSTKIQILSDLAMTSFHRGDVEGCTLYSDLATKVLGYSSSESKSLVMRSQSLCEIPPEVDRNFTWLASPQGKKYLLASKMNNFLIATAPVLNYATSLVDENLRKRLNAGSASTEEYLASFSDLHNHLRKALSGGGDLAVLDHRYVTYESCMAHSCGDKAFVWIDTAGVADGKSVFVMNYFPIGQSRSESCFAVGSRTVDPRNAPQAFWKSVKGWMKSKDLEVPSCWIYLDGRTRPAQLGMLDRND